MRIRLKVEGGLAFFPGLSKPIEVDTQTLPATDAQALERLVSEAAFFDRPAVVGVAARGAADYRQYLLSVEDGSRAHSVRILEPVTDPTLRALVERLRGRAI